MSGHERAGVAAGSPPDPRLTAAARRAEALGYRTRLTAADVKRLHGWFGAEHVILPGDERLARYGRDETEDLFAAPACCVRPAAAEPIAELLAWAQAERVPVTPWSAGTSLSGGAIPVYGGVALSLERMNRILDIDETNLFAVVEPGLITQVLQEAVAARGLFYPPDPASRGSSTIGGNLSMNAGGPRCVKYGVTKDYVTGLQAVLPTGERVAYGGKLLKNVTGYNLVQLLVGAEGTLGIITEATLRLIPHPTARRLVLAPFPDVESCAACVAALFQAHITPSACELLTRDAVACATAMLGTPWPAAEAPAHLLLEVDGFDDGWLDELLERLGEVCEQAGARDVLLADSDRQQAELWALRRACGEAVKRQAVYREEDTVVPRARLPELVRGVQALQAAYGIRMIAYGHAGDGNLHINILKQTPEGQPLPEPRWQADVPRAIEELFRLTVSLGGTLTGEHGVGFVQREYLPLAQSPADIQAQWRIKRAWDPANILNPGKVFPDAVAAADA